jgi:hypothetical protein
MVYEVPASQRSIKQNQFEFKFNGKKYKMPLLKYLPMHAAELLQEGEELKAIMLALDNEAARNAVRQMDAEQFKGLMSALAEASGVSVGESEGSAGSSKSTAEPSPES